MIMLTILFISVRLSFSLINTVHHCRLLYSIHFNCSAMNDSISRKHHTNTEYFLKIIIIYFSVNLKTKTCSSNI